MSVFYKGFNVLDGAVKDKVLEFSAELMEFKNGSGTNSGREFNGLMYTQYRVVISKDGAPKQVYLAIPDLENGRDLEYKVDDKGVESIIQGWDEMEGGSDLTKITSFNEAIRDAVCKAAGKDPQYYPVRWLSKTKEGASSMYYKVPIFKTDKFDFDTWFNQPGTLSFKVARAQIVEPAPGSQSSERYVSVKFEVGRKGADAPKLPAKKLSKKRKAEEEAVAVGDDDVKKVAEETPVDDAKKVDKKKK